MALSQGSVITITDINAEFDTKIDTAGAGLSKDGTTLSLASLHSAIGSAGPTANATPAYGATFTVPQINYDTYGRVTGYTNRTVKIPAAPSSATAISNCAAWYSLYDVSESWRWGAGTFTQSTNTWGSGGHFTKWKAPSGGTWGIFPLGGLNVSLSGRTISGGTTIEMKSTCIAIRIA